MITVSAVEARTNLSALLKRVARVETIQITLRGVPVAKLVPADSDEAQDPREVVREICALRTGNKESDKGWSSPLEEFGFGCVGNHCMAS
jgi:prevent-host-death family protein